MIVLTRYYAITSSVNISQAERFGYRARYKPNMYGFAEVNLTSKNDEKMEIPFSIMKTPHYMKPAVEAINYIAQRKKLEDDKSQVR